METWDKLPLNLMDKMADAESRNRYHYRPIYSLHKWWARRPGSTFRCLGLAALTDENITKDDILTERNSGTHDGLYIGSHNEQINPDDKHINRDVTVLDPFAGGGTTLVELSRLGVNVIGYELNPVAWWVEKKSLDGVNIESLKKEFEWLKEEVLEELYDEEVGQLYTTSDPQTEESCEVLYYFQTQRIPCLTCDEDVQLFPRYQLSKTRKNSPGVLYCPNQDCDDRIIELDNRQKGLDAGTEVTISEGETRTVSIDGNEICPNCGFEFSPNDGTYGYGKYTCSNGHKHDVKETLQRRGEKPRYERFAIQYIDPKGNKKFKEFDKSDEEKANAAQRKLNKIRQELPIPSQNIPEGYNTNQIRNWNYEEFSDLFTDRHLLTFGLLFKKAWSVREKDIDGADSQNIAEFLITAVSNCLERNSKLTMWNYVYSHGENVFRRHAYVPRVQPIEAGVFGTANSSIDTAFEKLLRSKEYCEQPFEKIKNAETGDVEKFIAEGEKISNNRLKELGCGTAESLPLDDESIDYIITDPPYYDNVQYSELSDYFYVWLRECLKQEYNEFQPELAPKAREIVANTQANKDEEFFVQSLSNVFSECYRVLERNGEMVFTYHHNENEAWSVILEAVIDSGFTINGAYPVQSEMPQNPQIHELDSAEYDILIYATKEQAKEEITLGGLRKNLFFELQDLAAEERERHDNLSKADLGVILRGKCMYYYSKHYPNIYSDGEEVGIDEALDTVDSVIEQVLGGSVNLPPSIDLLTQAYAAFCQRESESFDDLNKALLGKNLNVSDLEDEKLVKGSRDKKEPVPADERIRFIERKLNKNGNDGETLLDIDKVQYLYHLYKTDQNTTEYLKDWKSDDRQELAEFMSEVTGDERYEHVMEMNLSQF